MSAIGKIDLLAEYRELKYEYDVELSFDRAPTEDFMRRVMKLLGDIVQEAEDSDDVDATDLSDIRAEVLHRVRKRLEAAQEEIETIIEEEIK